MTEVEYNKLKQVSPRIANAIQTRGSGPHPGYYFGGDIPQEMSQFVKNGLFYLPPTVAVESLDESIKDKYGNCVLEQMQFWQQHCCYSPLDPLKEAIAACMEKQRQQAADEAAVQEAKQATGAPNFNIEVLANTFESHSYHNPGDNPLGPAEHLNFGHPAAVVLTNLGAAIVVEKVLLNNRPECSATAGLRFINSDYATFQESLPKVLKTGDALSITPLCAATVTVSIETNRGTVNYKVQ